MFMDKNFYQGPQGKLTPEQLKTKEYLELKNKEVARNILLGIKLQLAKQFPKP